MDLSHEFSHAANLGVIAKKWFADLECQFEQAGIVTPVKTGVDGAASLLAPAALVAQLIKREVLPLDRPLTVLVMGEEPVAVMDEGVWLTFAADLAGASEITVFSTCKEVIHSSLYEPAKALGLKPYQTLSVAEARARNWDLAVWVHPAIESGQCDELVDLIADFHSRDIPVYGCMYNEMDSLIQTHGLAPRGLEFSWLDSPVANSRLTKASVNKFGIATADIGIEGGWGAVLTRVQKASVTSSAEDWASICVAMELYKLEGATAGQWCLGEVIAGVSFNQCRPVGLIGNMAVDPATGLLLEECPATKVLNAVGHLWLPMVKAMPKSNFDLLPWAARVKLAFNAFLTKEEKKRAECIALLERSFEEGMVEAGLALARGYESVGTTAMKGKADAIYQRIGAAHPMSAYYLAHQALANGSEATFFSMLNLSVAAGYAPAITDLGCVMTEAGDVTHGHRLLTLAMDQGDAEAAFRLGEQQIKAGEYERAVSTLRSAWGRNHQDALNTAHWLCNEMLKAGIGKQGKLKRELKDIQFAISKRVRYENQASSDDA